MNTLTVKTQFTISVSDVTDNEEIAEKISAKFTDLSEGVLDNPDEIEDYGVSVENEDDEESL